MTYAFSFCQSVNRKVNKRQKEEKNTHRERKNSLRIVQRFLCLVVVVVVFFCYFFSVSEFYVFAHKHTDKCSWALARSPILNASGARYIDAITIKHTCASMRVCVSVCIIIWDYCARYNFFFDTWIVIALNLVEVSVQLATYELVYTNARTLHNFILFRLLNEVCFIIFLITTTTFFLRLINCCPFVSGKKKGINSEVSIEFYFYLVHFEFHLCDNFHKENRFGFMQKKIHWNHLIKLDQVSWKN